MVNVEAVVTGRDGSRIHGLGPKDFRLIVDGKPVPIDYFTEVHEGEATLQHLAQETGGKPLFNSNRMLALATAIDDTRSYYWLGFSPDWRRNDQRHTIKVEMLKAGLDVRSRNGFR